MNNKLIIFLFVVTVFFSACSSSEGDFQGTEYMPDMAHSTAYEANYYDYYKYNTWGTEAEYYKMAQPRKPVKGTIPRGYAGVHHAATAAARSDMMHQLTGQGTNAISVPVNGSVPYHYEDTEEERTRAMNEIINNPFPITDAELAKSKELYDIYCGVCHGEKGDGNGYLVAEENPNAVYPAAPANFLTDEFIAASNGRYYHAIMYGKNVMGGYADKLSYEERWQVVHYIRSLQAKEKKLVYSEAANTLNVIDVPGSSIKQVAVHHEEDHDGHETEVHHDNDGHDHGHSHDAGHHEGDGHDHHDGDGHDHGGGH